MDLRSTLGRLEEIVPTTLEHAVAAEITADGGAVVFVRENDSVKSVFMPFSPFLLLQDTALLANSEIPHEASSLDGDKRFRHIAKFANPGDYGKALSYLKGSTGAAPASPVAPYRAIQDMQQQLFILAGFRLFRGMAFRDIRRMQFDIETLTTPGFEFPNARRDDDRIAMISMSDSTGWEQCLVLGDPYTESELIERFVETVLERNPDVLEGHNIFKFDLPYIETRAEKLKVKLKLGRDNSKLTKRPSRISIAERTINYPKYQAFGRHIIDTFHLLQHYDVIHRELESLGLKDAARHFGVASPDRTYVEGACISSLFKEDPARLARYALDDVRETRAISDILSPSVFYQTQLIPISYQNCAVRGNASRIEAVLVSHYLNASGSIPSPEPSRPFAGALTGSPETGVFDNVWHCDVRSLYPSVILSYGWAPSRDSLKAFPFFLDRLRSFRLAAKDAEKKVADKSEKDEYNALQTSFKILINSFYGYLGFAQGSFNDYQMAENVTSKGREILRTMLDFLESEGSKIIEMDTDGIYFQPPKSFKSPADAEKKIQSSLPEGIDVELDAVYPAMFSYKSKNYALLGDDGDISITGAALKSRGLEPFQRVFIKSMLTMLLKKKDGSIAKLIDDTKKAISSREWELAKFAKTETLSESPESYQRKIESGKGRRSAAYELALNAKRQYSQGDQVSFYVTGTKKNTPLVGNTRLLSDAPQTRDDNTQYYLAKIDDIVAKFAEFIPADDKDDNPLGLDFG